MKDKTIIYKSYDSYLDAVYARSILRQNGVEAFISGGAMLPLGAAVSQSMGGTKLHIFEDDLPKVEEILNESGE